MADPCECRAEHFGGNQEGLGSVSSERPAASDGGSAERGRRIGNACGSQGRRNVCRAILVRLKEIYSVLWL